MSRKRKRGLILKRCAMYNVSWFLLSSRNPAIGPLFLESLLSLHIFHIPPHSFVPLLQNDTYAVECCDGP